MPRTVEVLRTLDEDKKKRVYDAALWACMWKLEELRGLKAGRRGAHPRIPSLTFFRPVTDEELRMQYVDALSQYGSIYYSSEKWPTHPKPWDRDSRLSTMAEFYLLTGLMYW